MPTWDRTAGRRRLLIGMLAPAIGACLALPGAAGAQAPTQDSAVGNVTTVEFIPFPFPIFDATFDARSGPQGENPTGSVRLGTRQFIADGTVTCLTVTQNRATIGFADVEFPEFGLEHGLLFVEDNGTPGVGRDRIQFTLTATPPTVCPVNTIVFDPDISVFTGDLTVVDAQPGPATKDDCKRGGWVRFGFRNQGQCVAFVQRGPKP